MPARILFAVWAGGAMLLASGAQEEQASAERGKDLFVRRCSGCHSLDTNKEGPRLRGVYGRKAATVTGFDYSEALKQASVTWDKASLNQWLSDPDKMFPDTNMEFGVKDGDERKAVIAYLKSLGSQ